MICFFNCCIFSGPASGGRAVRVLHELLIDGKKLVAKVDAKNKQLLDSYKEEESKKSENSNSKTTDAESEKKYDDTTVERIDQVIEEYQEELKIANAADNSNSSNNHSEFNIN